eukprot:CAMPEP_0172519650 /NCGR_PEP_ID=MMETSP1066-20121228/291541_1 /TAXON_ID=671091 /ORGANISM="Coscinodiscus wailesii, Strain CCMP2513" /LENGTH=1201 /DNA_ID=CAMNT_0013302275 /DNA_START=1819 /DNA_END=5424 /DNA_ORIENTATION=-
MISSESDDILRLHIIDKDCINCHNKDVEVPISLINSENLVNANTTDVSEVIPPDNLKNLTHLHEASVVHYLRKRYLADKIYTAAGAILLVVNPFKHIAEPEYLMDQYWNREFLREKGGDINDDEGLSPHVYEKADNAFRQMMKGLSAADIGSATQSNEVVINQSILVSGESGAGKTFSSKLMMNFLAAISERMTGTLQVSRERASRRMSMRLSMKQSLERLSMSRVKSKDRRAGNVEQKIVQSNPILESFGNARTHLNDNSSRFGKYIEMRFTRKGVLIGAAINSYLLEKIRLIAPSPGERNYHVFYEMLQGCDIEDEERFHFEGKGPTDFKILSHSGTYNRRDGIEDIDAFGDLVDAFETLGFDKEEESNIFAVTAAILHMGNLTFKQISVDECKIDETNESLAPVLDLMQLEKETFNDALCYFNVTAGKETIKRAQNLTKVPSGLEALIKGLYNAVFNYIVARINEQINPDEEKAKQQAAFIGVLDIFGFESFKVNSLEQLFINYCNESLQQQFNRHVFKNKIEEYAREGIELPSISFPDNQDALDFIDKKNTGLISILDAHCNAPGGSDCTFASDLYKKCPTASLSWDKKKSKKEPENKDRFSATRAQQAQLKFTLLHYAEPVEYSLESVVEKNKDELPKEAANLLLSSTLPMLHILARELNQAAAEAPVSALPGRKRKKRSSAGSKFSCQMRSLRDKIDATDPHYVRCLKPNNQLIPNVFDALSISGQLMSSGVIEAMKIRRAEFSQRFFHDVFVGRYCVLDTGFVMGKDNMPAKELCDALLLAMETKRILEKDGSVQVGKTKVFLKQCAFDLLEMRRAEYLSKSVVIIQTYGRSYLAQRNLVQSKKATLMIQCAVRQYFARKIVQERRMNRAAIIIKSYYQRFCARRWYMANLYIALWYQRFYRGAMGRKKYSNLNQDRLVTLIQKAWRRYHCHCKYQKMKHSTLFIQCFIRCYRSRRELWRLKKEARDLGNTKKERDELKVEVEGLKEELQRVKEIIEKLLQNQANGVVSSRNVSVANKKESDTEPELEEAALVALVADYKNGPLRLSHQSNTEDNGTLAILVEENRRKIEQLQKDLDVARPEAGVMRQHNPTTNTEIMLRSEVAKLEKELSAANLVNASVKVKAQKDAEMYKAQIEEAKKLQKKNDHTVYNISHGGSSNTSRSSYTKDLKKDLLNDMQIFIIFIIILSICLLDV